jgi:hypothetical protein
MLAESPTPFVAVFSAIDPLPVAFGYAINAEPAPSNGSRRIPSSPEEISELRQRYSSLLIQMDRLRPMLASVDVLYRPETPGEWSIKEILGHIIDTDRDIWWPRINAILESETDERSSEADEQSSALPVFSNIDQDDLIRKHRWQSIPLDDIFAQLMRIRWNYAMQLGQIPLAAFTRRGHHPTLGELTPLDILNILIAHDAHYVAQIESLIEQTNEATR